FGGSELGGIERDLHRLLLKDRDAVRPLEDRREFVPIAMQGRWAGNGELSLSLAMGFARLEIRMNHVALNRPRPDDRHFDHQIVELARLQPRQHVHLSAALDLEYSD